MYTTLIWIHLFSSITPPVHFPFLFTEVLGNLICVRISEFMGGQHGKGHVVRKNKLQMDRVCHHKSINYRENETCIL